MTVQAIEATKESRQASKPATFQLKGGLFTLTTIQLMSLDFVSLAKELAVKVQEAPKFFHYTPIVIDLVYVNSVPCEINFVELVTVLRDFRLIPVGVRAGTPAQQTAAQAAGLAVMPEAKRSKPTTEVNTSDSKAATGAADNSSQNFSAAMSKIVTAPVRSGQQIYAKGCDLIVLSAVSPGAEVLADGHIHCYGPLRGRALAGVLGNSEARVFCRELGAELISIAGHYCLSETLKDRRDLWQKSVSVFLQDEHLQITAL